MPTWGSIPANADHTNIWGTTTTTTTTTKTAEDDPQHQKNRAYNPFKRMLHSAYTDFIDLIEDGSLTSDEDGSLHDSVYTSRFQFNLPRTAAGVLYPHLQCNSPLLAHHNNYYHPSASASASHSMSHSLEDSEVVNNMLQSTNGGANSEISAITSATFDNDGNLNNINSQGSVGTWSYVNGRDDSLDDNNTYDSEYMDEQYNGYGHAGAPRSTNNIKYNSSNNGMKRYYRGSNSRGGICNRDAGMEYRDSPPKVGNAGFEVILSPDVMNQMLLSPNYNGKAKAAAQTNYSRTNKQTSHIDMLEHARIREAMATDPCYFPSSFDAAVKVPKQKKGVTKSKYAPGYNSRKNNVKTYRDLQQEATLIDCHRLAKEKEKEERRVTWGIPKVFTSHDEYDEANLASGAVDGILVLPPPGADVKRKPLYLVANMEDHGDPEALANVLLAHSRKEGRGVVNVKKQSHCPTHVHSHTHAAV